MEFAKETSVSNPVKNFRYIDCYSSGSATPLKTLAILLDSAVEREVLKLTSKCEKGHIFRGDQQAYCLKICQKERTKFQESQTLMFY